MSRAANAQRFARISQAQTDPHQTPPEHHLLAALIGSGVAEATWPTVKLANRDHGTSQPSATDRRYALDWLMEDGDRRWSFVWCCQHLGLDPEAIRERVRAAIAAGVTIRSDHLFYGSRNRPGHAMTPRPDRLVGHPREGGPWSALER